MLSPRKSRKKSACFSSTTTGAPARASKYPAMIPAGTPPTITHRACNFSDAFIAKDKQPRITRIGQKTKCPSRRAKSRHPVELPVSYAAGFPRLARNDGYGRGSGIKIQNIAFSQAIRAIRSDREISPLQELE